MRKNGSLSILRLATLLIVLTACGGTPAEPTASAGVSAAAGATSTAASVAASSEASAATSPAPEVSTVASAAATNEKLDVIATYSILGDLVQNVGGDLLNVRTLVGPGGDPHLYEPTPQDSAALAEAALVFENGIDFEIWLDDLYDASGSAARRVVVTEQVELRPPDAADEHAEDPAASDAADDHAEDQEHSDGEWDPHVWNDPNNAMLMVEAIRDALVEADGDNAAVYRANAETYLAQLKTLDVYVEAETETLAEDRRKLVTTHDTFGYFADRYGYEVVGTALGSVSTEVADPSAGEIAALITEIKAAGVPAVFAENSNNPAVMEQIAAEAGVTLAPTLYPESLSEPDGPAATYLDMVRHNIDTIVTALGQ